MPIDTFFFAKGGGWRHINATNHAADDESGHAVAHYLIGHGRDRAVHRLGTGKVVFAAGQILGNFEALMNSESLADGPEEFRLHAIKCFAGPAAERRLMVERRGYGRDEETCSADSRSTRSVAEDTKTELSRPMCIAEKFDNEKR